VSAVTLDGSPVAFTAGDPTQLTFTHAALSRGTHVLRVTTPWGTSEPFTLLAFDAPLPPQITSVTPGPGSGSVTVSFAATADDGGEAVYGYGAFSSPSAGTCTTLQLSCVVTRLTPGTAYTFTTRAVNDAGVSVASAPSAPVIAP
jgi:hypothetical protein